MSKCSVGNVALYQCLFVNTSLPYTSPYSLTLHHAHTRAHTHTHTHTHKPSNTHHSLHTHTHIAQLTPEQKKVASRVHKLWKKYRFSSLRVRLQLMPVAHTLTTASIL